VAESGYSAGIESSDREPSCSIVVAINGDYGITESTPRFVHWPTAVLAGVKRILPPHHVHQSGLSTMTLQ